MAERLRFCRPWLMDECDVGGLMRDLSSRLVEIYWNVIDTNAAKAIVRGVFTNQRFLYDQPVADTGKVPEQLVDAVLCLDTQPPANEVHQYKYTSRNAGIGQHDYSLEHNKAASPQDFFILFTTNERRSDIALPRNPGIVDAQIWSEYFGPFAGRAFIDGLPNINEASLTTLQLVDGVR